MMYHKNNKTDKVHQSYARYIIVSKSYLKYKEFIFTFSGTQSRGFKNNVNTYHKNNKTDKVYRSYCSLYFSLHFHTLNTKNLYNLFFQGHNPEDLRTMHHFGYCAKDDAEHCQIMRDHRRDSKYAKMGTWPQHYFRNTGVVNLHLVQGTVYILGQ